jgi:outer membrane lipoprotein-sorting protein
MLVLLLGNTYAGVPLLSQQKTKEPQPRPVDILQRSREAMGGEAVSKMTNMVIALTVTSFTPQGNQVHQMENTYAKPARIRQRTKFEFGEIIIVVNGTEGWIRNAAGIESLRRSQTEDARVISLWIVYDVLQNYRSNMYAFSYIGKKRFANSTVHVISVRSKAFSHPFSLLIDTTSYYVVGKMVQRPAGGRFFEMEEMFSNFRRVEGVMIPFTTMMRTGSSTIGEISFHDVKINTDAPASIFVRPKN